MSLISWWEWKDIDISRFTDCYERHSQLRNFLLEPLRDYYSIKERLEEICQGGSILPADPEEFVRLLYDAEDTSFDFIEGMQSMLVANYYFDEVVQLMLEILWKVVFSIERRQKKKGISNRLALLLMDKLIKTRLQVFFGKHNFYETERDIFERNRRIFELAWKSAFEFNSRLTE